SLLVLLGAGPHQAVAVAIAVSVSVSAAPVVRTPVVIAVVVVAASLPSPLALTLGLDAATFFITPRVAPVSRLTVAPFLFAALARLTLAPFPLPIAVSVPIMVAVVIPVLRQSHRAKRTSAAGEQRQRQNGPGNRLSKTNEVHAQCHLSYAETRIPPMLPVLLRWL